jgi:hypothetical protein
MSIAYLIGTLVGALVVLDGVWMMADARPLLPIPRWNYPNSPAPRRWMGVAETIGGTGIAAGFGLLAASGPTPAAAYIVLLGVVGQCLAYGAAWLVNARARRPVST